MSTLWQLLQQFGGLFKWWIVVLPWEQALRVRLGKHARRLNAGIHLKIPIIDRVFVQSVRKRFSMVPTQTLTMQDGRTVTVSGSLGYIIEDIEKLYDTLHHAEATIEAETQGIVADFIISTSYEDFTPDRLQAHVEDNLDFSHYGLRGAEFIITTFVCTKTYRLLMGEPRDYTYGEILNTRTATGESGVTLE